MDARLWPSSENDTVRTRRGVGSSTWACLSLIRSQTLTVPAVFIQASLSPAGLKETACTGRLYSLRIVGDLEPAVSHRRTVRSQLPEASCLPSGLKATQLTQWEWPA